MLFAFYIISFFTLGAALLAVSMRNLIHCTLAAALSFLGIAALFFLLKAEFIGVIQLLIYIGAIATLILFTIMLTSNLFSKGRYVGQRRQWSSGIVISTCVLVLLIISIRTQTNLPDIVARKADVGLIDIGTAMMTTYVLPFEVISLLLTAAMIGGIVLALRAGKD